ncbi:MAG: Mrp/NBP35 family ATP-binding protein, partial [Fimbriimonadales bacterium]|nr:Mrp/NBP35 family ATP-binding protein [Fimbriimonadales bacterium]
MRRSWVMLVALACAWAHADRVIEIPTGRLLYPQYLKAELGLLQTDRSRERWLVNWRVGSYVELSAVRSGFAGAVELAGVQINLYPELPNYAPGISVGVTDLFDRSGGGRGYYLALSYSVPMLGETPLDHDLRVHLGFGVRGMPAFFVGFEIPLTNHLFALAEHTGRTI